MIAASKVWWNLTRASANVAWVLILLSIIWGVLLTTRALRKVDRPAWLRDLHSWLGGLALVFTGLHMVTLIFDSYVDFTWIDLVVPFSTTNYGHQIPVALGILGFYALLAVQITSLMMKKMSQKVWHLVHYLSYFSFAAVAIHALTAGSDVGKKVFTIFSMIVVMIGTGASGIRWVLGRYVTRRRRARESAVA